jgi:uncharacterized protein (UPF0332 family)
VKTPPKHEEVTAELLRAEKSLKAAKVLLDDDLLEDALSRTYYAILHAARAVLLSEGVRVSSHKAVRRLFGQYLIKTDKLSKKYATILAEEQDDRYLADYDVVFSPEKERVQKRIMDAKEFLEAMKKFLQKHKSSLK